MKFPSEDRNWPFPTWRKKTPVPTSATEQTPRVPEHSEILLSEWNVRQKENVVLLPD